MEKKLPFMFPFLAKKCRLLLRRAYKFEHFVKGLITK